MSLINQCSGTYTPEGIDLDFALQVPEEHRVYKDPEFYNNITYCDKLNLSGWSFTTEPTLNIHDFYVYMAAMPLWEEYESRMHRAGLSKTTRSLGANNNYAFYDINDLHNISPTQSWIIDENESLKIKPILNNCYPH